MNHQDVSSYPTIHRHTGGLETNYAHTALQPYIHRHTGGLEM